MGELISFPTVCRLCFAKKAINTVLSASPTGEIVEKEICTMCGTLQREPKVLDIISI